MATASRQLLYSPTALRRLQARSSVGIRSAAVVILEGKRRTSFAGKLGQRYSGSRNTLLFPEANASSGSGGRPLVDDPEDGVSLGTMKLPGNTDPQRFDALLFQWANSLCQGANVPLPVPLKVDKLSSGARLAFISIEDGKTEVLVYIDCLVFPPTSDEPFPLFRAIRNGPQKDKSPPGEPRIMRSLLQALQKSVEIAKL